MLSEFVDKLDASIENLFLEGEWVFKGKKEAVDVYSYGSYEEDGSKLGQENLLVHNSKGLE